MEENFLIQKLARTVVGTRWPIRDDDAASLFESFYRHLGEGASLSAALMHARRDAIADGLPARAWGALVLVGDGPLRGRAQDHARSVGIADRVDFVGTRGDVDAILAAEDERGHVHHAFFKDAMLDRFYAICNCCECCCGAMQAHRSGTPMLASSGYVSQVDEQLCLGCGDCVPYCQFHALKVVDGVNHVFYDECMGCGICTSKCQQHALSLVKDEAKGMPLEICSVMKEAIFVE